ncbi:dna-directed rna polymerase ii [Moniliophthora roreri]|uniref:DNA-directed RNA polymerase RBP11-like dimerisation domain-containing protein n=1 Tax=Moniliophthora roreri TaxID=221103 RepID=A0A0W0FJF8_MONRR|nr:dna-directed rna polymerase ii [Moniliophthora roreri]
MNQPNRYELFVLDDGERPVEVTEDTKIPNAATIKIVKQDHTLAGMLRAQLLSMPQVLFAGYKVPHPLHPYFIIKIQTDGSITPEAILEQAALKVIGTLASLEAKFKREFSFKEVDPLGTGAVGSVAPNVGEDPYGAPAWGQSAGTKDYLDF